MIRPLILLFLFAGAAPQALASAAPPAGYTISRTVDGVQLTLAFDRRDYPAHALVAVTATLRNVSHQHLAVQRARLPYGLCSWPAILMVSINARGEDVEPVPPIPAPLPPCPFPGTIDLPVGHSMVEHQLIVLWSPRLRVTAQVYNHAGNGYMGFAFQGPTAHFRLHLAPDPTISTATAGGTLTATISPPPGARGPLYYRSWGDCAAGQNLSYAFYWTRAHGHTVSSGCAHPTRWHLDAAWLNTPVASLNLGAIRRHQPPSPTVSPSPSMVEGLGVRGSNSTDGRGLISRLLPPHPVEGQIYAADECRAP
jgi:hypothetical protein